jgi:hypothetical protein
MNLRAEAGFRAHRECSGVRRLTPISRRLKTTEGGLPPSFPVTPNAFSDAAGSGTHQELAVPRMRPSLPPPKEQAEAATAEERLVQELRPLARVLLIQARREIARRAREAQAKAA